MSEEEQLKAAKGTVFIPFSQFPPKKLRKDCFYHYTPAMSTPTSLENVHSCEVTINFVLKVLFLNKLVNFYNSL